MARTVRLTRRGNPGVGQLPVGEWIPAHAVRFNDDGTTSVMTEEHGVHHNRGRRRRNIAAGFVDEDTGVFHPIRASYDYSRSRAGEPPPKRRKAGRKKAKAKAKAKTKRRRR